jgi:peptidoglycan lytic transglycosylase
MSACSLGGPATDSQLGVAASPRVANGRALPKGGGHYKVGKPYRIAGRRYVPREDRSYDRTGVASWYGKAFHGRRTANGEIYDMHALTAGHPTLPLPSYAYVTNRENGRTILVRINDRGPYVGNRIIDLSRRSAQELGFTRKGLTRVRVRYAGRAPLGGSDAAERRHLASQSWHRGNVKVAQRDSGIVTGSLERPAPAWSVVRYRRQRHANIVGGGASRASLGGPEHEFVTVGPFASRAEAARMRHMLAPDAAARVERLKTGALPEFQVRLGPLDARTADIVADSLHATMRR